METKYTQTILSSLRKREERIAQEDAAEKAAEANRKMAAEKIINFLNEVIAPALEQAMNELAKCGVESSVGNGYAENNALQKTLTISQSILSFYAKTNIAEPAIYTAQNGKMNHSIKLTEQEVEETIKDFITKSIR